MKRLSALSALAVAVGLLASASAHAGLEIDDASTAQGPRATPSNMIAHPAAPVSAPSVSSVAQNGGELIQKGTPMPGSAIKGWASDVPLLVALKQIVPDGWRARRIGHVDVEQHVSWKGGQPWTDVLGGMASTYGFNVVVNWDTKEVAVSAGSTLAKTVPAVKTLHASSDVSSDGIRMTTVTSTKPIGSAAPVPVQTWFLSPKMTLRENIEAWAKTAGWTVSWGAADYPIVAGVTLQGALDADNGPVATVMKAYEDAEQPLVARVSEANHVIRVENRDYQQSQVSSTNVGTAFPNLRNR